MIYEFELKRSIDEHVREIHAIEDLSQQRGNPRQSLRKAFKRSGGVISLGAYITQARYRNWHRLSLIIPSFVVTKSAYFFGIERPDVAAHVFQRAIGMTMPQYCNHISRQSVT